MWTVRELAEKAGVHRNTIVRVEAGEASHGPTMAAIKRALEDEGIEFLSAVQDAGGPGVRFKSGVKEPERPEQRSASGDDRSPGGIKALDQEMADHWAEQPGRWAKLSESGRQAISMDMFGDPNAADGMILRGTGL